MRSVILVLLSAAASIAPGFATGLAFAQHQTGGEKHQPAHQHGNFSGQMTHPGDPAMASEHDAALNLAPVSRATHVAAKDGAWSDAASWSKGIVPAAGAVVYIPEKISIVYDRSAETAFDVVRVDGVLSFAPDRHTKMVVDTLLVTPPGRLRIGTKEAPIRRDVEAVIEFADNGPIDISRDPQLLSRGLVSHGDVQIHGARKTSFLRVAAAPRRGDRSITLEAAPVGWKPGDRLVLTGTRLLESYKAHNEPWRKGDRRDDPTEDEELIVTGVDGAVVSLDRALRFNHDGPRADLKAYLANYTRNVRFQTANAENLPVHQRAHVMFMHSDKIDVRYAEFHELGRTDKSHRAHDVAAVEAVAPDTNIKARYPLHIHRSGVQNQARPAMIVGAAVWRSPGWGLVHHDSHAIFDSNASYDTFGAGYIAETGNETGRWVDNIAIKSNGVKASSKEGKDLKAFDLGRNGVGYWFQGRLVEAVGNVAAGMMGGVGFTYMHRGHDKDVIQVTSRHTPQHEKLRYETSSRINKPNITLFRGNEAIATKRGLEVIKANPQQRHDVRSIIEDFTAWENEIGAFVHYTGHYTLRNLDLVKTRTKGRFIKGGSGVNIGPNTFDIVLFDVRASGYREGVSAGKVLLSNLKTLDGEKNFNYVYIDLDIKGAREEIVGLTPSDRILASSELVSDRLIYRPLYDKDFSETMKAGRILLHGTKIDSLGEVEMSTEWDPFKFDKLSMFGAVVDNGFWTSRSGATMALIEEYVQDRATGEMIKQGVMVELPAYMAKRAQRMAAAAGPGRQGRFNPVSKPPVTAPDVVSGRAGERLIIDPVANDSDPENTALTLDGVWSNRGHVLQNDDGTITYFADQNFRGEDFFYYWVRDGDGKFARGKVTVAIAGQS